MEAAVNSVVSIEGDNLSTQGRGGPIHIGCFLPSKQVGEGDLQHSGTSYLLLH